MRTKPCFLKTCPKTRFGVTAFGRTIRGPPKSGPRCGNVWNITELPSGTRDLIAASLKGQVFLPAQDLQLDEALDYGGLAVLKDAWSRLGVGELFSDIGSARQRGLLQATIFSRLLFPCAKFSLAQRSQGTWPPPACGLDANDSFNADDICCSMHQVVGH